MKTLLLVPAALAALAFTRPTTETRTASLAGETWKIDPVHSSVMFSVMHANAARFYGMFREVTGEFTLDSNNPENCKVSATIATEGVATRNDDRDKHLRGPDFFDSKQFPTLKFTSTKVTKKGSDAFEVLGEVEMRGKKKAVTAMVTKTGEGELQGRRIGFEATLTIKRSDFGMSYGLEKKALFDEVALTIAVEGVAKK